MNEQQQNNGWHPVRDAQNAANVLFFTARAFAAPVEVILRRNFGSRYFGFPALAGLLLVPLWMAFWPDKSGFPILVFWWFYILMQVRARLESARMVAKGNLVHTRYNGWPRLARVFKRMSEEKIKGNVEPAFVILVGVLLLPVSQPLGSYLMLAGVSLGCIAATIESVERARAVEMHDAMLEQQQQSERFRQMRDHRR